jgi:hypothetical protein
MRVTIRPTIKGTATDRTRIRACEVAGGFRAYPANMSKAQQIRARAACMKNDAACRESFEGFSSSSSLLNKGSIGAAP